MLTNMITKCYWRIKRNTSGGVNSLASADY
jgi:hypothetical protein